MNFFDLLVCFYLWVYGLIFSRKLLEMAMYVNSLDYITDKPLPEYGLLPFKDQTDEICRGEFNCKQLGSNLIWALKSKNSSYIEDHFDLSFDKCGFTRGKFVDAFYPAFAQYHANCPIEADENEYRIYDFS